LSLALPCLALPCLALPCLALPCLALPLPCLCLAFALPLPCLCLAFALPALPCLALPRSSMRPLQVRDGCTKSNGMAIASWRTRLTARWFCAHDVASTGQRAFRPSPKPSRAYRSHRASSTVRPSSRMTGGCRTSQPCRPPWAFQNAHGHAGYKAAPEAIYYAFDLLWLDSEDTRRS
jgi:hypothetical protein